MPSWYVSAKSAEIDTNADFYFTIQEILPWRISSQGQQLLLYRSAPQHSQLSGTKRTIAFASREALTYFYLQASFLNDVIRTKLLHWHKKTFFPDLIPVKHQIDYDGTLITLLSHNDL